MNNTRFISFQAFVHLASISPLVILIWDYFTNNLTYNPLQEATLRTGKTALILLLFSLSCTPINAIFGFRQAIRARRTLGLYAFAYASIHFLIFIGIDYAFQLQFIFADLAAKCYILIGFIAYTILFFLAITSTIFWQKRLRKRWKWLHRLVYPSAVLVIIHYIIVVKANLIEPLIYGSILILLFVLRAPSVHRFFAALFRKSYSSK